MARKAQSRLSIGALVSRIGFLERVPLKGSIRATIRAIISYKDLV